MADVMEHVEAAAAAASSSEVASRRQPPRHATFLIDDSRFSSADFLFIIFFLRGATSSLRAFPFIKFITEASLSSFFFFSLLFFFAAAHRDPTRASGFRAIKTKAERIKQRETLFSLRSRVILDDREL